MIFFSLSICLLAGIISFASFNCSTNGELIFEESAKGLIVRSENTKVLFSVDDQGQNEQTFYFKDNQEEFKEVLRSYRMIIDDTQHNESDSTWARLYDSRLTQKRYLITEQPAKILYNRQKRNKTRY